MKITEELLNEMKIKDENFSDGLIKPDGDYVRIPRGHLHGMMELLPWTENEIWKMIPDDDSPLFWLIEKTGCVLTDYNNSYDRLVENSDVLTDIKETFITGDPEYFKKQVQ